MIFVHRCILILAIVHIRNFYLKIGENKGYFFLENGANFGPKKGPDESIKNPKYEVLVNS